MCCPMNSAPRACFWPVTVPQPSPVRSCTSTADIKSWGCNQLHLTSGPKGGWYLLSLTINRQCFMRVSRLSGLKGGFTVAGLMVALSATALQETAPNDPGSPSAQPSPPGITAKFSPAVSDVLKMLDAKVDIEVIK